MKLARGCTTRPYNMLTCQEAFAHIARAGYTDVAIFANAGQVPVSAESTSEEVAAVREAASDASVSPSMVLARTHLDLGVDGAIQDYCRLIDRAAEVGARWIDSKSGDSTPIGNFSNTAVQSFSTPDEWEDTILILEAVGGNNTSAVSSL